ncbi:GntR family transcriptional regulator [Paraburkholderia phymatum]|uniref:Regulatory protein GntR HTH n=1 Tax=Paraburkholderia phymatum (strain DSM 17167 / CIP 108236 / LMG 21445 / STM815) TaxID=391038 RepID=B2JSC0_PARP8|nr:GntR family transcriptional regulator [Paraburkholderia phymatum]ACC73940.1 regulatory protein GntR HTH [Paraburkholderia phymatum STM815]
MLKDASQARRQPKPAAGQADEHSPRRLRAAMFAPIANAAGASIIVTRLRTAIDLGFFSDGELLPKEAVLADELNVGVFSVREALAQLRSEGLVETRAGRGGGTVVRRRSTLVHETSLRMLREISSVSLRDLSDWRSMLLAESAALAARRSSGPNLQRLIEYVGRIKSSAGQSDASRAHARFDIELASAAQSVRLTSAILDMYEKFAWLLGLGHASEDYRKDTEKTLRLLVKALEARDENLATSHARKHASQTFDYLVRLRLRTIAEHSS